MAGASPDIGTQIDQEMNAFAQRQNAAPQASTPATEAGAQIDQEMNAFAQRQNAAQPAAATQPPAGASPQHVMAGMGAPVLPDVRGMTPAQITAQPGGVAASVPPPAASPGVPPPIKPFDTNAPASAAVLQQRGVLLEQQKAALAQMQAGIEQDQALQKAGQLPPDRAASLPGRIAQYQAAAAVREQNRQIYNTGRGAFLGAAALRPPSQDPVIFPLSDEESNLAVQDKAWSGRPSWAKGYARAVPGTPMGDLQASRNFALAKVNGALPGLWQGYKDSVTAFQQDTAKLNDFLKTVDQKNLSPKNAQILQKQIAANKSNAAVLEQRRQTLLGLTKRADAMVNAAGENPLHSGMDYPEEHANRQGFGPVGDFFRSLIEPGVVQSDRVYDQTRRESMLSGQYPPPAPFPAWAKTPDQKNELIRQKNDLAQAVARLGPALRPDGSVDPRQAPPLQAGEGVGRTAYGYLMGANDPRFQADARTVQNATPWQHSILDRVRQQVGAEQQAIQKANYGAGYNISLATNLFAPVLGGAASGAVAGKLAPLLASKFGPVVSNLAEKGVVSPSTAQWVSRFIAGPLPRIAGGSAAGAAVTAPLGTAMGLQAGQPLPEAVESGVKSIPSGMLLGGAGAAAREVAGPAITRIQGAIRSAGGAAPEIIQSVQGRWGKGPTAANIDAAVETAQTHYGLTDEQAAGYRTSLEEVAKSKRGSAPSVNSLQNFVNQIKGGAAAEGPVNKAPSNLSPADATQHDYILGRLTKAETAEAAAAEAHAANPTPETQAAVKDASLASRNWRNQWSEFAKAKGLPGEPPPPEQRPGPPPGREEPPPAAGGPEPPAAGPSGPTTPGPVTEPEGGAQPEAAPRKPSGAIATIERPPAEPAGPTFEEQQPHDVIEQRLQEAQAAHTEAWIRAQMDPSPENVRAQQMARAEMDRWQAASDQKAGRGGGPGALGGRPGFAPGEGPEGPSTYIPGVGAVSLRRLSPDQLTAIGSFLAQHPNLTEAHAPALEALQNHLAWHAARDAQYEAAQIPPEARNAAADHWNDLANPARQQFNVISTAARNVGKTNTALGEKLNGAAQDVQNEWRYTLAHQAMDGNAQLAQPEAVPPPMVSTWRQLSPEEQQSLPGAVRRALLIQDLANSAQSVDPEAPRFFTTPRVSDKQLEQVADQRFNAAQQALASNPPNFLAPQVESGGAQVAAQPTGGANAQANTLPVPQTSGTTGVPQGDPPASTGLQGSAAVPGVAGGQVASQPATTLPAATGAAPRAATPQGAPTAAGAQRGQESGAGASTGQAVPTQFGKVGRTGGKARTTATTTINDSDIKPGLTWKTPAGTVMRVKSRRGGQVVAEIVHPAPTSMEPGDEATFSPEMVKGGRRVSETEPTVEKKPASNPHEEQPSQSAGGPKARPERRQNAERRKRVAEMTPEERAHELLTDAKFGVPNARAYEEAPREAWQVYLDADSMKWWNDAFKETAGYAGGDALIQAMLASLAEVGLTPYRIQGDEIVVQGSDPAALKARLDAANDILKEATVSFQTLDGRTRSFTGAQFSYGMAETSAGGNPLAAAEAALGHAKSAREAAGLRAAPGGGRPPGVVEVGAAGGQPAGQQELEGHPAEPTAHRADQGGARAEEREGPALELAHPESGEPDANWIFSELGENDLKPGQTVRDRRNGELFELDRPAVNFRRGALVRTWSATQREWNPDEGQWQLTGDAELSEPDLLDNFDHARPRPAAAEEPVAAAKEETPPVAQSVAAPAPVTAPLPARAETPAQVSAAAPEVTPQAKPLWEMSQEELEAAHDRAKEEDRTRLDRLFGPEGAKRFRALERKANSSTAPMAEVEAASNQMGQMAATLTPAERDELYGIGDTAPQADEIREYESALGRLDATSAHGLGDSLKWAITNVGQESDPAKMTHTERIAYAQLREGARLAAEHGLDTNVVTQAAIQGSAARFADKNDAAFMLQRFINTAPAAEAPTARGALAPAETGTQATPTATKDALWREAWDKAAAQPEARPYDKVLAGVGALLRAGGLPEAETEPLSVARRWHDPLASYGEMARDEPERVVRGLTLQAERILDAAEKNQAEESRRVSSGLIYDTLNNIRGVSHEGPVLDLIDQQIKAKFPKMRRGTKAYQEKQQLIFAAAQNVVLQQTAQRAEKGQQTLDRELKRGTDQANTLRAGANRIREIARDVQALEPESPLLPRAEKIAEHYDVQAGAIGRPVEEAKSELAAIPAAIKNAEIHLRQADTALRAAAKARTEGHLQDAERRLDDARALQKAANAALEPIELPALQIPEVAPPKAAPKAVAKKAAAPKAASVALTEAGAKVLGQQFSAVKQQHPDVVLLYNHPSGIVVPTEDAGALEALGLNGKQIGPVTVFDGKRPDLIVPRLIARGLRAAIIEDAAGRPPVGEVKRVVTPSAKSEPALAPEEQRAAVQAFLREPSAARLKKVQALVPKEDAQKIKRIASQGYHEDYEIAERYGLPMGTKESVKTRTATEADLKPGARLEMGGTGRSVVLLMPMMDSGETAAWRAGTVDARTGEVTGFETLPVYALDLGSETNAAQVVEGVPIAFSPKIAVADRRAAQQAIQEGQEQGRKGGEVQRQAWQMTKGEFLGKGRITRASNAAEMQPYLGASAKDAPAEPFLGGKYTIKRGALTHVVMDGEKVIASYDGNDLVVARPYRRQGIGQELVYDFRTRHPEIPPAPSRTKAAQHIQENVHRRIVQEALREGKAVPTDVLADYPDLEQGQKGDVSRAQGVLENAPVYDAAAGKARFRDLIPQQSVVSPVRAGVSVYTPADLPVSAMPETVQRFLYEAAPRYASAISRIAQAGLTPAELARIEMVGYLLEPTPGIINLGLHVHKGGYHAVWINPFVVPPGGQTFRSYLHRSLHGHSLRVEDPEEAAYMTVLSVIHELAHIRTRQEMEPHWREMDRIWNNIGDATFDAAMADILTAITGAPNGSDFTARFREASAQFNATTRPGTGGQVPQGQLPAAGARPRAGHGGGGVSGHEGGTRSDLGEPEGLAARGEHEPTPAQKAEATRRFKRLRQIGRKATANAARGMRIGRIGRTYNEEQKRLRALPIPVRGQPPAAVTGGEPRRNLPVPTTPHDAEQGAANVWDFYQVAHGMEKAPEARPIMEALKTLRDAATRDFIHLPAGGSYAEVKNLLRRFRNMREIAGLKAQLDMLAVVKDLAKDPESYDLFNFALVARNLAAEVRRQQRVIDETGKGEIRIPELITPHDVADANAWLDETLPGFPKVQAALEKRAANLKKITQAYFDAAKRAVGVQPFQQLEDYFHQQVLEHAGESRRFTAGGRGIRVPVRGFTRHREGYTGLWNTNWIQSEFEVLSQMVADTMRYDLLHVVSRYSVTDAVKAEAAKRGLSDWRDAIPEQYRIYQPVPNSLFFRLATPAVRIANAEVAQMLSDAGVPSVLLVGARRQPMVLPEALAQTLDEFGDPGRNRVDAAVRRISHLIMKPWKAWEVLSPPRVVGFTLRKEIGELEVALVNMGTYREMGQAIKDVVGFATRKGRTKGVAPDLRDWMDRGGWHSLLASAEHIDQGSKLRILADFVADDRNIAQKTIDATWGRLRLGQDLREATTRYAMYRSYLAQMRASVDGLPNNFGASDPREIMAIPDLRDRAWKLADELGGAYGSQSAAVQYIADHGLAVFGNNPFFRFQSVNMSRFVRIVRNVPAEVALRRARQNAERGATAMGPGVMPIEALGDGINWLPAVRPAEGRPMDGGRSGLPAAPGGGGSGQEPPEEPPAGGGGAYEPGDEPPWYDPQTCTVVAARTLAATTGMSLRAILAMLEAGVGAYALYMAGRFILRAAWFHALMWGINYRYHPREVEDLPNYVRGMPVLILGRDAKGNVIYISRLSALEEVYSWIGLDNFPGYRQDYLNGHQTAGEIAYDMLVRKPWDRLTAGGPVQTAWELRTGKSFFPDSTNPRDIQDKAQYAFQSVGLGQLYDAIHHIPERPGSWLSSLAVHTAVKGEAAWDDTRALVRRFQTEHGHPPTGGLRNEAGAAIYNYKRSLQFHDARAATYWLGQYVLSGGTADGVARSLKGLDPMHGLTEEAKSQFFATLSPHDRDRVLEAMRFYGSVVAPQLDLTQPTAGTYVRQVDRMSNAIGSAVDRWAARNPDLRAGDRALLKQQREQEQATRKALTGAGLR